MSRSIASYPKEERQRVVRRRLAAKTKGNGYWAAVDASMKMGLGTVATPEPLSEIEKDERRPRDESESQQSYQPIKRKRSRKPVPA